MPWWARDFVHHPLRKRAGRPQLKREPLDGGNDVRAGQSASFSHAQARAFYDHWGGRQDWLRLWEDAAIRDLIGNARFDQSDALVEFGCGTGRVAELLLERHLKATARYLGVDTSPTMAALARQRLARFGTRAEVRLTEGEVEIAAPPRAFDRFVSTYVVDLLPRPQIDALLSEARRLLAPGGLICLVSLTHGGTPLARLVEHAWTRIHGWRPFLVGGCRPLSLQAFFGEGAWRIRHRAVITSLGVSSEVVVAQVL